MGNNHKHDPPEKFCLWCEKSLALKKMQKQVKFCGERGRRNYRKNTGYFRDRYLNKKKPHLKKCTCLLYTSPSPRDATLSRMPSSA